MSELTANEATALMAAGMYASPPTEAQMKDGIERAESWLAAEKRRWKAEGWDEGFNTGYDDQTNRDTGVPMPSNPYESQETP